MCSYYMHPGQNLAFILVEMLFVDLKRLITQGSLCVMLFFTNTKSVHLKVAMILFFNLFRSWNLHKLDLVVVAFGFNVPKTICINLG